MDVQSTSGVSPEVGLEGSPEVTAAQSETPMPALYLGHGAPPLLDDLVWPRELAAWAARLPRPRGILIVSAHWEAAPIMLSSPAAGTPLVYDFGGFAPHYYQMTYSTPDATQLASLVRGVLPDRFAVHEHPSRGLDHGAWVPLKVMYPDADIPVLQMSIPSHSPEVLLELGARLRPLRDQGILIIGSGYLTHGLPFLTDWSPNAAPPGWSVDFDAWAAEMLEAGDVDQLSRFHLAPGMPYAHPTVEHFTPIFITLGAADDPTAPPETTITGNFYGLSKRSFQVA